MNGLESPAVPVREDPRRSRFGSAANSSQTAFGLRESLLGEISIFSAESGAFQGAVAGDGNRVMPAAPLLAAPSCRAIYLEAGPGAADALSFRKPDSAPITAEDEDKTGDFCYL